MNDVQTYLGALGVPSLYLALSSGCWARSMIRENLRALNRSKGEALAESYDPLS